jgi:hypothetical protein
MDESNTEEARWQRVNAQREQEKRVTEKIKVDIGGIAVTYHVVETNAEQSYDGFGTFELLRFEDERDGKKQTFRTVLIDDRHVVWQTERYLSGWNQWQASPLPTSAFIDELWRRVRGIDR